MQKEKGVSKSGLSVAGMGIQCSLSCVYQRRSTTPFILVHEHAHIHIYVLSVPYHCCCKSLQAFANNWYSGTDNYTKMCRPSPPCRQGPCSTTWPSPQGYYPELPGRSCSDHHPLYQPSQAVWLHFSGAAELKVAKLDKQVHLAPWKTTKDSRLMWPVAAQPAPFSLAPLQTSCGLYSYLKPQHCNKADCGLLGRQYCSK